MRRVFLLLAAVLYVLSLQFEGLAERSGNGIYILLDKGITVTEAEKLAKSEQEETQPMGFCFYGISETASLRNPETGRTVQAVVMPVYGNGELLGAGSLSWRKGCMVDAATARTLFGTDTLGAQQVGVLDGTLPALGTVDVQTPTVLITAQEDMRLNRCVIAGWDENGKQAAEQFLLRHGLTGKILNFYPLLTLAKNMTLLPLWALLILLCRAAGGRDRRFAWLAALFGIVLLGSCIVVPKDAIPSMWSDFSFWSGWAQRQRENILTILMSNMGEWSLKIEENVVKSVICALAGAILTAWAGRRTRRAPAAD